MNKQFVESLEKRKNAYLMSVYRSLTGSVSMSQRFKSQKPLISLVLPLSGKMRLIRGFCDCHVTAYML